jgi:Protein of unknown function (DUF3060)
MKSLATARSFVSVSLFTSLAALTSVASAEVVFDDAAQTASHDCGTDPEVSIQSSSGTYTLTGTCTRVAISGASNKVSIGAAAKVSIAGSSNEVTIEAADKIAVVGSSNQVRWKKGLTGPKPKVSNVGTQNKVSKVK